MSIVGFVIILAFLLAGEIISALIGHFVPGSVIGMILMFMAICLKCIRTEWIRSAADFLTRNMTVMFIPASIGILEQWGADKDEPHPVAGHNACMLGDGLRQRRLDSPADIKKEEEKVNMNEIMTGMPAMLLLTLASYLLGVFFQKSTKISVFHPFITAMVIIIATLFIFDIPYESYREGNRILDFLLGPSVVALALKLYDNIDIVKKNLAAILSAVVTGSIVGIVGVWAIGRLMNCPPEFIKSLEAKSVTTPIVMDITGPIGGSTSLVAISVVITGVLGAVLGSSLLKVLGITDPVAKGVSMGCASHGVGTGRAIELGAIEGAVSGLCIVLMGIATSILVPLLNIPLGL